MAPPAGQRTSHNAPPRTVILLDPNLSLKPAIWAAIQEVFASPYAWKRPANPPFIQTSLRTPFFYLPCTVGEVVALGRPLQSGQTAASYLEGVKMLNRDPRNKSGFLPIERAVAETVRTTKPDALIVLSCKLRITREKVELIALREFLLAKNVYTFLFSFSQEKQDKSNAFLSSLAGQIPHAKYRKVQPRNKNILADLLRLANLSALRDPASIEEALKEHPLISKQGRAFWKEVKTQFLGQSARPS